MLELVHRLPARRWLAIVGLLLLLIGLKDSWQWYYATHNRHATAVVQPIKTVTHSTNHPDETPVASVYTVPAGQPRQIQLPAIKASGFIQKVGVDQHNAVAVPSNVNLAGWYTASPLPGMPGVSIIDGHVQGYYNPGIFKHLADSKPGDAVNVEYGDHSWRYFSVLSVTSYAADQASTEQYKQLPGVQNQLTLITCGGPYDSKAHAYQQRVVVRASLKSS